MQYIPFQMSQHLMSVTYLSGAVVKLVAGFAPRLCELFVSLREARLSAPDETPQELIEEKEAALKTRQTEAEDAEYEEEGEKKEEADEGQIMPSNEK
jgi:hypothetical protein